MPPAPPRQARADAIAAEITARLAGLAFALPGTLPGRLTRRGHPGCRCRADPPQPHGPYHQRTRKKNGSTSTRILPDDQLAHYRPWSDNHKRLRELITELEELSLAIAEAGPRRNRQPGAGTASRRNRTASSRSRGQRPLNPWAAPRTTSVPAAHPQT